MKRREVLQAGMALGGLAGLGRALAQGGFTLTLVHTNDTHENFRLATAPLDNPGEWTTLIAGSAEPHGHGLGCTVTLSPRS